MAALYYALTINILKVLINNGFRNHIHEKIENSGYSFINNNSKDKIIKLFDDLIAYLSNFIADFLSTYNIFLEKLVIGTLYLFLFYEPKKLANNPKYLLVFRLLSLFPISFIIISLVLRALQNTNILVINEYVLSFLMGPKITIYGFFITTLSIIKYKEKKYNNIFDEDNTKFNFCNIWRNRINFWFIFS